MAGTFDEQASNSISILVKGVKALDMLHHLLHLRVRIDDGLFGESAVLCQQYFTVLVFISQFSVSSTFSGQVKIECISVAGRTESDLCDESF